jgi:glycosyltransferase involved in cell wall biosynthesis
VKITAAVIARDEERHIAACLEKMTWADERLVLDGGSADRTVELSQAAGARVEQRLFDDFARQRNAALALAENDWVLFVDADERVTDELAGEVRQTVESAEHDGYCIPRFNYIFGKVIRHSGWYPDYQMRLLDRRHACYDEAVPVHEVVRLARGEPGYLRQHLVHYNYQTLGQFFRKQEQYSDFEARQLLAAGRPRARSLLSMPVREFARRYWQLRGYRDGGHGLLLSLLMAYFTFRRYQKCFS